MTIEHGLGMLFMGVVCIFIATIIAYYIINRKDD
jgi:hypothetical protein